MVDPRSKVNMKELDVESKKDATKHIVNLLQRPGQLEKVAMFKKRYSRKKASVEALLKSAMQSQLNGVIDGLNLLATSIVDMKEVEVTLKSMNKYFETLPTLSNNLREVREENMRHSQYVTAKENLKHIFTVPESIEKTNQWISDGKLLHTHQCLRDLENSRDDLLFELHKLPNQSMGVLTVKKYFSEVETLSTKLEGQLRLNLTRTLNAVRKKPTVIVTALRIIEREEKSDEEAIKQHKNNGFMPPGRPKEWKKMAFKVLEQEVALRIEGKLVEERADDKLWLVRYLELIRQLILEDLRVVKTLCVPVFPPSYNIIDEYIKMYHKCLSKQLNEIIENGLEGNEYVSILAWTLNTYLGPELMGHPDLIEHTKTLPPLLEDAVLKNLKQQYLSNMEKNYTEWLEKTLETEVQEWKSHVPPIPDVILRTSGPSIIFEMIGQNLEVTKTINQEITNEALFLSIRHVENYSRMYRNAIIEFKQRHFEDRRLVPFFTQYMITIVNNCLQLVELGVQYLQKYGTASTMEMDRVSSNYKKIFFDLRTESSSYLLEEAFLDVDKHFDDLFRPRWINDSTALETVTATLEDYFFDYKGLVDENFELIMKEAQVLVAKRYLVAMLSKRISFKTFEECQAVAAQIIREARKLQLLFTSIDSKLQSRDDPLEIIIMMAEVVKTDDDMMSLDLHRVVERYPDITEDHLLRHSLNPFDR